MDELKKKILDERNFKVNYFKISGNLWRAEAEVKDDLHQIKTWLEISILDFKIKDAGIEFIKMPFEECKLICEKAKKLIGTKVKDLGFKIFRTFLGINGCSNVYLLFGLSGPGFYNIYQLNMVNEGIISQNDYNLMMKKDCVAHKEINIKKNKNV